ncbi:hypothetical protein BH09PSE6_BH09PSE6_34160 [soil metagenome]
MTTSTVGAAAEQRAREYLERQGLVLVASNWRAHFHTQAGELDLVMRDGATLVFVEVRARASRAFGGAAASVTPVKQARLRLAARAFLQSLHTPEPPCRFDVVAFEAGRIDWLRDAF